MRGILTAKLATSNRFNTEDCIDVLIEDFEKNTKLIFDAVDENYYLTLGRKEDHDPTVGVSRGRMKLTGCGQFICLWRAH